MVDYEPLLEILEDIIMEANIAYDNANPIMTDYEYDSICITHRWISKRAGLEIHDSFSFLK